MLAKLDIIDKELSVLLRVSWFLLYQADLCGSRKEMS